MSTNDDKLRCKFIILHLNTSPHLTDVYIFMTKGVGLMD